MKAAGQKTSFFQIHLKIKIATRPRPLLLHPLLEPLLRNIKKPISGLPLSSLTLTIITVILSRPQTAAPRFHNRLLSALAEREAWLMWLQFVQHVGVGAWAWLWVGLCGGEALGFLDWEF
jgi:hypothetical protein